MLTWVLDVPAGVSWHQGEDNLEVFVGTGIILCGSVSWGFAFSGQSLLPLQSWVFLREFLQSELQAGLQLTHTLSSHLLQEESESTFISPEPHLSFSQIRAFLTQVSLLETHHTFKNLVLRKEPKMNNFSEHSGY